MPKSTAIDRAREEFPERLVLFVAALVLPPVVAYLLAQFNGSFSPTDAALILGAMVVGLAAYGPSDRRPPRRHLGGVLVRLLPC